jgi:hypothetical protein
MNSKCQQTLSELKKSLQLQAFFIWKGINWSGDSEIED